MGKKIDGDFLRWPLNGQAAKHVQDSAVQQLLMIWEAGLKKTGYPPLWGDEVEYAIVNLDDNQKRATLALEQENVLEKLQEAVSSQASPAASSTSLTSNTLSDLSEGQNAEFTPEFASYMVEAMPGEPYGESITDLLKVENAMLERREAIARQLDPQSFPYTLSIFPRLGIADALASEIGEDELIKPTASGNVPGHVVSGESRYQAAHVNIPARQVFQRTNLVAKFQDQSTDGDPIRLTGTIFGPGHCGLQATFQAKDETEARMLHDQLIPLGPIMLALTAATPIYSGFLANTDARWNQIAAAVDDRDMHEVNGNIKGKSSSLPKRWFCNTTYLAKDSRLRDDYQFQSLALNDEALKQLEEGGLDHLMAHHFAHIFVRDPIMISTKDGHPNVPGNDEESEKNTNHFDSLNGTVWPHVRLKIPPLDDDRIGWRVEFRAMETQITDFENAAFCMFMALVRRIISHYDLNMYMPLKLVKDNMQLAHEVDAVTTQKFKFRSQIISPDSDDDTIGEYTVNDIINGNAKFPGLLTLARRYIQEQNTDPAIVSALEPYLMLVQKRASGELWTAAHWMREFVRSHRDYKQDSCVSTEICYDLIKKMRAMVDGQEREGSGMF